MVRKYIFRILQEPTDLEHMQNALLLYAQLKAEVGSEEEQFPQITEQIYTLDKYSVPIPQPMRLKHKNLPKEWAIYLEALEQAEHMLEYSKVLLKET